MKNIFRFIGIIALTLIFGFTLTTCGGGPGGGGPDNSGGNNKNFNETITTKDSDYPAIPKTPASFSDITASALVGGMKIGWNLGNSLDATGGETAWGNPKTTKANIDAIKARGFNTIRIPVSWSNAVDKDYNIRVDWMNRVVEVVNYAVANDMYIILNTHHDEGIFKFTNNNADHSKKVFKKVWGQIAFVFRNYNEKLIFEGLNEPRTKDSSAEWSGGTAEERANLNAHYQIFVDTVRASGGNNGKRILQINTYGASAETAAINGLTLPTDSASNKLIVSIHAYAPYNFALNQGAGKVSTWSASNSSDTSAITDPMNRAKTAFIDKGIPVVMGEFGATNRDNESYRAAWAQYYVSQAKSRGIKCVWWDNGQTSVGDDSFGIFNRSSSTFLFSTLVTALIDAS